MIALLTGTVAAISGNIITLDVSGVGYEVYCTRNARFSLEIGSKTKIIIYTEVKEDLIRLYGFEDELEKQVFLMLTSVKGLGARTSSEIVSKIDKRELLKIIGCGDLTALQSLKGIGKKTAERIIVELKDKVADYALERNSEISLKVEMEFVEPANEAIEAMQALGLSRRDAEKAVSQVNIESIKRGSKLNSSEIVKEALRYI